MELKTLHDVYVHQLKDVYSAEKQIIDALPKMVKAASSKELQSAFEDHLEKSKTHLDLVQQILDDLDENPTSTKCVGMAGLLKEGEETIKTAGHGAAKDAMLISAAQRVEHYEMAAYGSVRTYATLLGYEDVTNRLQHILNQEGEANKHLTQLAEGDLFKDGINDKAAQSN
jgi:ferritin-like metal-binding protein YciE